MQKEKAKSKRGVSIKKHSSTDNNRNTKDIKRKRTRNLHRQTNSDTSTNDTIHSITFQNKAFLDVCDNDYQDELVEIINDIYPANKSELNNLVIKQETPGFILNAIFSRLSEKYPKYELFIVQEDKWVIRQNKAVSIDFYHLAIDDLIRHCDSNWDFIECLVYTISLLNSHCGIQYGDDSSYAMEGLVDEFNFEPLERDNPERIKLLKKIWQIRFGFYNRFMKCVYHFKITSEKYLKKISKLKPVSYSQAKMLDFFHEAYTLANSGYTIDHFHNPYDAEDGYVCIDQMIRFVWSVTNDPLNVSEELIDLANNSGWNEPDFYNDITETSKEIVVPQEFYQFQKLMNDARFNTP